MALSSLAALLFVYLFMPALWLSIMSVDESLDAHEAGLALVASRTSPCSLCCLGPFSQILQGNPFRETGPPANMAKLILLRHKVRSIHLVPTQLLTQPSRFKRATESDVVPHIHDKHHEHTSFPRLAQKQPGCASGNHLGENSITDAAIPPLYPGPLTPCRRCFITYYTQYSNFLWICNTTITCFVATPLSTIQG